MKMIKTETPINKTLLYTRKEEQTKFDTMYNQCIGAVNDTLNSFKAIGYGTLKSYADLVNEKVLHSVIINAGLHKFNGLEYDPDMIIQSTNLKTPCETFRKKQSALIFAINQNYWGELFSEKILQIKDSTLFIDNEALQIKRDSFNRYILSQDEQRRYDYLQRLTALLNEGETEFKGEGFIHPGVFSAYCNYSNDSFSLNVNSVIKD